MKKRILVLALFTLRCISILCNTDHIRVSVLTLEPGNQIYSIFGHTAIRITNDSLNADLVYNFGTFDFNDPNFYLKFIKGNLNYFLSIAEYPAFIEYALIEDRTVHEQVLLITEAEKMQLFDLLVECYNSPQRYYRYDFFYNNCATKVRDFIFSADGHSLNLDSDTCCCKTFRQLLFPYTRHKYWLTLGINLLLGPQADKTARPDDYMFLPYYIHDALKKKHIADDDRIILASGHPMQDRNFSWLSPWLIVAALLALIVPVKTRKIAFFVVLTVTGTTGLLILLTDLISANRAYSCNYNVYWTLPAILPVIIRNKKIAALVTLLYLIVITGFLWLWNFLPQKFSSTFIPWMVLLIIMLSVSLDIPDRIRKKLKTS